MVISFFVGFAETAVSAQKNNDRAVREMNFFIVIPLCFPYGLNIRIKVIRSRARSSSGLDSSKHDDYSRQLVIRYFNSFFII